MGNGYRLSNTHAAILMSVLIVICVVIGFTIGALIFGLSGINSCQDDCDCNGDNGDDGGIVEPISGNLGVVWWRTASNLGVISNSDFGTWE